MIVGDAARVVDPITGGGIYNAMFTGRLATEVASGAIGTGDCCREALLPYDARWRASKMGETIERNYHVKEYFIKLSDEKLNALAHSISRINLQEFSTLQLVKELIRHNPTLLIELTKLLRHVA
jgi:digeranylgeranylglycerophospholipid reductase